MPAQGRGPRAGGGAQSPEPPSEVRSPRPGPVGRGRAGALAGEAAWKGGRLETVLGLGRALAAFGARGLRGVALGRAERDSPSSAGRGARLRAAAARVLRRRPSPLHPARASPPQDGAQLAAAPARSLAWWEGSVSLFIIYER